MPYSAPPPPSPAGARPPSRHRPIHRLGDRALLVDCADLAEVMALHARLVAAPLPGQAGLVPAASTLLIRFRRSPDADRCAELSGPLSDAVQAPAEPAGGGVPAAAGEDRMAPTASPSVSLPVLYDGADLDECAAALGCSPEAVVGRHVRARWRAAFAGFAPGFAYLVQDPAGPADLQDLTVPRRASPRTRVPAGSVALAGDHSAVYPQDSPGGWQLIGHTETAVWDVHRDSPALLSPGTAVSFRAVRDVVELREAGAAPGPPRDRAAAAVPKEVARQEGAPEERRAGPAAESRAGLRVLSPGLSTTLQDPGRQGWEHLGVGPSGWSDPEAAREANRVVGNPPDAVVLEHAMGGLSLRAEHEAVLAVCGARGPLRLLPPSGDQEEGRAPLDRPFLLPRGTTLRIGPATRGLRFLVAVRGGIHVEPVLGSAATDTLSGLGPPAVSPGTLLRLGEARTCASVLPAALPVELPPAPHDGRVLELPMAPGPRADWFTPDSLAELPRRLWRVSEDSNRVAARLEPAASSVGPPGTPAEATACDATPPQIPTDPPHLRRVPAREGAELASEPLVTGSVQIPPSGHPVLFLADRPVTGGYPVIGVLTPQAVRLAAQAPPGTPVRLIPHHPRQSPQENPCAPS